MSRASSPSIDRALRTVAPVKLARVRVVAVDWSGNLRRAPLFMWLAEVRERRLVSLQNGFTRQQLIERLIEMAREDPHTVVGLDFAFSFPRWWCEQRGWDFASQVWAAMACDGEQLLDACKPPLWGRPGRRNPHPPQRGLRRTDRDPGQGRPKSVFQIGGGGAVGTGSVRGMAHLPTLAAHGFSIWPFDPVGGPAAIEIYPRALTGPVNKSSATERRALLSARFPAQPATLLERAAGSEDAFDAAVSALVMADHEDELAALAPTAHPDYSIEGRIWRPVSR